MRGASCSRFTHQGARAARGVAAISTGVATGHAITLLATPVLSRIYSPADFGAFASFMAFVMIASTAGSLRLESAVPIASPGEARQMLWASALSSLLAGALCAAVVVGVGHPAISRGPWLGSALVVYIVWITSMYAVLTAYSLRAHQYSAVARRNLLQALGTTGGQLLLAGWTRSAMGLVGGLAIGRTLGVASLVREIGLFARDRDPDGATMTAALRRYWRFPAVFMPAALLNVLGVQLPILIVARAYGAESAGNLAQAFTFTLIPAALLGTAISSVVLAELAAKVRAGELDQRHRYLRVSRALAPFGLAWILGLVLLAPSLLPWVLGPQWESAGQFAAALGISAGTGLVVSPLSVVLLLYQRSAVNLLLDVGRVALVAVVGVAAWASGLGPVAAVLGMSVSMGIVYTVTWVVGLQVVSDRRSRSG